MFCCAKIRPSFVGKKKKKTYKNAHGYKHNEVMDLYINQP